MKILFKISYSESYFKTREMICILNNILIFLNAVRRMKNKTSLQYLNLAQVLNCYYPYLALGFYTNHNDIDFLYQLNYENFLKYAYPKLARTRCCYTTSCNQFSTTPTFVTLVIVTHFSLEESKVVLRASTYEIYTAVNILL